MHEVEYHGGASVEWTRSMWAWVGAAIVAVALVIFMQWFVGDTHGLTTSTAPSSVARSEEVEGGQYSDFALFAKQLVKLRGPAWGAGDEDEAALTLEEFREQLAEMAVSRTERLRLAIVAGELIGKDEAVKRLQELQTELEPGGVMASEVAWLKILYDKGPGALANDARQSLLDRHQWFGHVALAFDQPLNDPNRRAATRGRAAILQTTAALALSRVVMFCVGIGALMWTLGRLQSVRVDLQGAAVKHTYFEAFVLFCLGFTVVTGLTLLPFGLSMEGSVGAAVFSLLLVWVLVAAPAWPLLRGESWREYRETLGLHSGEGVIREVIFGVIGFLAWMPVNLLVALMLSGYAHVIGGGGDEGPSGYPMFENPPSDSAIVIFLSVISSVVWAPLVEEVVFRGLLFGWVRQWLSFGATLLIVSITFGIIHPYSPLGMVQVSVGGVLFALLREWRGSLIAPMVAHALHNGTITVMSLAIVKAIGG